MLDRNFAFGERLLSAGAHVLPSHAIHRTEFNLQANSLFVFGGGGSRYLIERELGQGGMGTVYQALDKERGTRVALKAITRCDALNIYRLKNEFRQLADISHPNLVALHELVSENGRWFFTMELIDGVSFDQFVAERSPLQPSTQTLADDDAPATSPVRLHQNQQPTRHQASATLSQPIIGSEFPLPRANCNLSRLRQALRQLVEAVAALHSAGKLHRDIKPSNLLVTAKGRLVVLDFGLVSNGIFVEAEEEAERTVGGNVFGTPAYMSPEQAAGEPVTTASDWYSMGSVLYEALTGQLPFDGSVLEILRQKEDCQPPPPSELVSGVPDDLNQLCSALLRREPRERPTGREVLRYLTGSTEQPRAFSATAPAASNADNDLFIGRDDHLRTLNRAFVEVGPNSPVAVLVRGHSGMGKSALVRCFANQLIASKRAVVLRGRCYERETVPYKAFDNVVDALSRYMMRLPVEEAAELLPRNVHSLAKLFPVLKRVRAVAQARTPQHQTNDPRELRTQAFGALKDLLLRISDFQPLVLQIDDLQWGDADSARLLMHLLERPNSPAILFVGAYRSDERENSPFLRHVLGEGGLHSIQINTIEVSVEALSNREAAQLTQELLFDYPAANTLFAHTIAAEAEGVPFFIGELVQHVKSHREDAPLSIGAISLDDVITERVARMPKSAQRLLRVLSVAAGPVEQAVAMQAARLPSSDRTALLSLRAARLVRTRGTRQTDFAETYHDRVRETVVAQMEAERIRAYHGRLAEAIEAWGVGDPERLVEHYSEAGDGMRAGETAYQAANTAADQLAFNRSAQLYEKAISLLPADAPQRNDIYLALAGALANAGKSGAAAEIYLGVAENAEPAESRTLKRLAAQQFLRSGRLEQGMALSKSILAEVGLRIPSTTIGAISSLIATDTRTRIMGQPMDLRKLNEVPAALISRIDALGAVYQEVGVMHPLQGSALQAKFLHAAVQAREPQRLVQGLAWQVVHLSVLGARSHLQRADSSIDWMRRILDQAPSTEGSALLYMAQSARRLFAGEFTDGIYWAKKADLIFENDCTGKTWERSFTSLLRYTSLEFTGDLSELAEEAPRKMRDAVDRDDNLVTALLTTAASYAHLMNDDPDVAIRFLTEQSQTAPTTPFTTLHQLLILRTTDSHLYSKDGIAAYDYASTTGKRLEDSYHYKSLFTRASWICFKSKAALAKHLVTGEANLLAETDLYLKRLAQTNVGFNGYHLSLQSTLAQRQDRVGDAIALTRQAITAFDRKSERGAIYARHRLGELLGGDEGAKLKAEAAQALTRQSVVDPQRWIDMIIGALKTN